MVRDTSWPNQHPPLINILYKAEQEFANFSFLVVVCTSVFLIHVRACLQPCFNFFCLGIAVRSCLLPSQLESLIHCYIAQHMPQPTSHMPHMKHSYINLFNKVAQTVQNVMKSTHLQQPLRMSTHMRSLCVLVGICSYLAFRVG
jgi:hypothetical protein